MYFYFCCSQIFILFIAADAIQMVKKHSKLLKNRNNAKNNAIRTEEDPPKDALFNDVMKNITQANTVLLELIQNYDNLHKIYNRQEISQNEYGDQGGDEFRNDKDKAKRDNIKSSTREFSATKMLMSDESLDKESLRRKPPKAEYFMEDGKSNGREIVNEAMSETSENYEKKFNKDIKTNSEETDTKLKSSKPVLAQIAIETSAVVKNNKKKNLQQLRKQIIKTETFKNGKIWSDIIDNKPLDLQVEKEIIYNSKKQPDDVESHDSFTSIRSANFNGAMKADATTIMSNSDSGEDDKVIKKEQYKTRILRKAYGDACLKVVVRKCYKACKRVIKTTCTRYDCKSHFKNALKEHSKGTCIKEFRQLELGHKADRKGFRRNTDENDPLDIKGNGYLAAACLPNDKIDAELHAQRSHNNEYPNTTHTLEPLRTLNILRDRYERQCQKTSSLKCTNACRRAANETCSTQKCRGKKKSALKKSCKRECKRAYVSVTFSNSDGDSDSKWSQDSSSSSTDDVSSDFSDDFSSDEVTKAPTKTSSSRVVTTPEDDWALPEAPKIDRNRHKGKAAKKKTKGQKKKKQALL